MIDFDSIFTETMGHEGIRSYTNDPSDRGGETYAGISRKHNPTWLGWSLIDADPKNIPHDALEGSVKAFYKSKYFDSLELGNLPDRDLASALFDLAVNMGQRTAVRFTQRFLNRANNRQKLWPDISEDGRIGKKTIEALASYLTKRKNNHIRIGERTVDVGPKWVLLLALSHQKWRGIGI